MRLRKVIASIAVVAALMTTGLGIAVGLFVLLAPTEVRCELPALQPGTGITGSGNCVRVTIFEMGRVDLALAEHSHRGLVARAGPQLVWSPPHPGPQARLRGRSRGAARRGDRDHQLRCRT